MWKFDNIKKGITGGKPQDQVLKEYIQAKNLNFIVGRGSCLNLRRDQIDTEAFDRLMDAFSHCDASMINWSGLIPSPPFLGVDMDAPNRTARVCFLIDLTREAEQGQASPFYSKIMGALATQFFAAQQEMEKLWFPFVLEDTVGRGVALESGDKGMFILRV